MSQPKTLLSLLLAPTLALAQVTINPTGGTGAGTGLRVHVGPSGQLQVFRNGTGQFYSPTATPGATTNAGVSTGLSNGVYLAIGPTNVWGPLHFASEAPVGSVVAEFTPISNTLTPQPSGSGSATTVLRATLGGRNYDLSVRYDYVFPNDFLTVTHTLTVPAGNTLPVRLYHGLDAFLGGSDLGPSFFVQGPPTVVGGFRSASNVVLAWRYRGGVPWTGYFAGFYECMFRDALCPAGSGGGNNILGANTFNNWVDTSTKDNGFAIMWNFGAAPATQVVSNDLTFFSYQPTLSKAFGATAITAGSPTTLTFTIDNVPGAPAQGNLGFLDTLPTNLLLANTTSTNTCGGTLTLNTSTLPHSIRLQSGSLAPLTQRCAITVNVTASVPGAYVNGRTNISAVSVLENQVSDQTLSVVQNAPVVILDSPGIINLANATAYPVSGTCQSIAGVVTVTVGTVITTTACTVGTFTTTVNVAALSDGSAVSVSASQTNFAGTGTTTRQTSKDTSAPSTPAFTSPADGASLGTTTPTISGTGEPGSTVRVIIAGTTVCTALTQGNGVWTCTTTALTEGTRTLTTSATDSAGNTSTVSGPRSIVIDVTPPLAPVINSPAAAATVGPNPTVSGTGEAFAIITVTEGAGTVCTVTANNLGQWSCATTFGPSTRTLSATQRDLAGNTGPAAASRTFTIANVPTVTLTTPAAITASNASAYPVTGSCTASAGTVTVQLGNVFTATPCTGSTFSTAVNALGLTDAASVIVSASQTNVTGTGTDSRTTQKDTVAPTAPTFTSPPEGARLPTSTPTLTGTAEPLASLVVRRGVTTVCTVVVPANGVWSCVASGLPEGLVTLTAIAGDPVGNTSPASPARNLTIDTLAPVAPSITNPAQNATVGINPSIAGTAEANATVSVNDGALLICSVIASATGQWSCPTTFQPGTRTVTATQRDSAGNQSGPSASRTFTVAAVPTVTLTAPGPINAATVAAYPVAGACTDAAGSVTVTVGSVTATTACSSGAFSTTVNASAVPDGLTVAVIAAQTNVTGTGTTRTTVKDTGTPVTPTFDTPVEGSRVNSNTPTLTGTAEANTTLVVRRGAATVCTVMVPATGLWSCVAAAMPEGSVTLTATASDLVGNTSPPSLPRSLTIDTVAPAAPVISNPPQNATVGINPSIAGTAEVGATVSVNEGALLVCTATANSTGQWSCPTTYQPGTRTITATQRDVGGNQSVATAGRSFTVASVPTVTLTTPGPINAMNVSMYRVAGSCTDAAGSVTLAIGSVNASTSCAGGAFSTTVNATSVADDPNVGVIASQTNPSGTGSDTRTTLKDTVVPSAPTFTRPAEAATLNDATPTFTGAAEPGSTVRVTRGAVQICTTVTPASGLWSCVSSTLSDGQIVVLANATDPAGNVSSLSSPRTFVVDTTAPAAPAIASPDQNAKTGLTPVLSGTAEPLASVTVTEGSALVCIATADAAGAWRCPTTLGVGPHAVTATQTDRAGNQSPASPPRAFTVENVPTVILGPLPVINLARVAAYEVSGFCTTGAGLVSVSVGTVSGTASCTAGLFSVTLNVTLVPDGPAVQVRAAQTTAGGTGSDLRSAVKDTVPPAAPVITLPTKDSVATTGRPLISGTAEANSTVTVFINGQLAGTATATAAGAWTFTPPTQLADGSYDVKASATDIAGNTGPETGLVPFNVDSTAPNPPVIVSPERNASLDIDRAFQISGTSEPLARVTVYLDGRPIAFIVADALGRWVVPVAENLIDEGDHVVSAEALDPAGNQSLRAADVPFSIRRPALRYAGQGLIGCSASGAEPLVLALLLLARRRRGTP